ncbi:hypothetical protein JZ751_017128 [Albula glossodonta]|uniref:Uncharacterized protein n=1 Tax=Albula glossodonta TaxID=121402 RepID=A0A8T2NPH4_9TELE|nr:hypothetical protein JZ751_017128 [Albula glossodonta]
MRIRVAVIVDSWKQCVLPGPSQAHCTALGLDKDLALRSDLQPLQRRLWHSHPSQPRHEK